MGVQFKVTLVAAVCVLSQSCCREAGYAPDMPIVEESTCMIAGHIYNKDSLSQSGIYPPFADRLSEISLRNEVDHYFFTGDMVFHSDSFHWSRVNSWLEKQGIGYTNATGNHDLEDYYVEKYSPCYSSEWIQGHLFLMLNTTSPGWTIDSTQATFVTQELKKLESGKSVFVLTHQLWWLRPGRNKLDVDSVRPNSFAYWLGSKSFWEDGFPLFDQVSGRVYFIAGDLGADPMTAGGFEKHIGKYSFYASGMGADFGDSYLMIHFSRVAPGEMKPGMVKTSLREVRIELVYF